VLPGHRSFDFAAMQQSALPGPPGLSDRNNLVAAARPGTLAGSQAAGKPEKDIHGKKIRT
jgi:hypothetical protein